MIGRIPHHQINALRALMRSPCSLQQSKQCCQLIQRTKCGSLYSAKGFHSAALSCGNLNKNAESIHVATNQISTELRRFALRRFGLNFASALRTPFLSQRYYVGIAEISMLQLAKQRSLDLYQRHSLDEYQNTILRHNSTDRTQSLRLFSAASNRNRGTRPTSNKHDGPDLINERLIKALLRGKNITADNVQVRLVIDQGKGQPSQIDIVSLTAAMDTSSKLGVDLVGINIKQDPPVIKAIDVKKLIYDKNKKSSGSGGGSGGSGMKQTKTYKFKAGIQENDLNRKAENVIKYLSKGHPCQITITSNNFNLKSDSDAVITTLNRVREVVGDYAVEGHKVRKNVKGSFATIAFQPNNKKRK
mmetsp:Transcript_32267/g.47324  ORF Transcript_32267/g.47324 Transcript_32267/m.47324 type:complete len:360 (-) Transcript_32267:135-1214(-)